MLKSPTLIPPYWPTFEIPRAPPEPDGVLSDTNGRVIVNLFQQGPPWTWGWRPPTLLGSSASCSPKRR